MELQEGMVKNPPYPRNFAQELLVLERGEGVYLIDEAGKRYLDFGSGISVNALGYGREDLASIAYRQMQKLIHISNLYANKPALELAEKMTQSLGFDAVQFGNSGSEANETAIKFARLYAYKTKGPGHHRIICFSNAFHGRTLGALSCTPTPKYQDPFRPLVPDVEVCPYGDAEALKALFDNRVAAVITEVVQGEGGLGTMTQDFAALINELAEKNDSIVIADEVQTGLGRCGYLTASEINGLKPDIISLAKPLAGGLPLSATLVPKRINELLALGEHGTTFGGGPVATAVASHVWDRLSDPAFLKEIREKGAYLSSSLAELCGEQMPFSELRGVGMLRGLRMRKPEDLPDLMNRAREAGLLVLRSGTDVLRIAPPLIIEKAEIDQGFEILKKLIN